MSKKDKKVVNSGISGSQTSGDDIVADVVEIPTAAAVALDKTSIEETVDVFDHCAYAMEPAAITGKPILVIAGKTIELTQMTPDQIDLVPRGAMANYFHDSHTGTHSKETFNKFAEKLRAGPKEQFFWIAKVDSRLFILSKGSRVTVGNSWDGGTAVFIASIVELERLSGCDNLTLVNTSIYSKSLYVRGELTIKHSTVNSESVTTYDTCSIRFSNLQASEVIRLDSAYVYAASFSGWTEIKLKSTNVNKYGDKGVQICSRYNTKRRNNILEIANVNLGEVDIPNRMWISDGDVIIRHRSHIGTMPGIDPVEFAQSTDGTILLGGELSLSLEELDAMRYRVPMPVAPMLNDGYQPTPMPWGPSLINKDGEVDKYDKLVRLFINGGTTDKVPQNTDQLLGIHFRPFYDAIVSRVKLFRILGALG